MISGCFVEFTLFAVSKASFRVCNQLCRLVGVHKLLGVFASSVRCLSCARYAPELVDLQRSWASVSRSFLFLYLLPLILSHILSSI